MNNDILSCVKSVINEWDPLSSGMDDEYDSEIIRITALVETTPNISTSILAMGIIDIFTDELGDILTDELDEKATSLAEKILAFRCPQVGPFYYHDDSIVAPEQYQRVLIQ